MIEFTGVFENTIASPMTPLDFVKKYYLSRRGRDDLKDSTVKQESSFAALENEESAQHSLQQLKAEIAALADEIVNDMDTGAKPYSHHRIVAILRQLSAV